MLSYSETGALTFDAQKWVGTLSSEQLIAINPVLQALSGVLKIADAKNAKPVEELRDNTAAIAGKPDDLLAKLESGLARSLETQDPQALRDSLSSCLDLARAARRSVQAALAEEQEDAGKRLSPRTATTDATTGLPARETFEKNVADIIREGSESLIALFKVDRLDYINKRFGRAAGDHILQFVAQYLAQELPDSNSLCRWGGPAFGAILNTSSGARRTEMQLRAIASRRLSRSIDHGSETAVMIPISCSCMIEPVSGESCAEEIFSKLESFLFLHTGD